MEFVDLSTASQLDNMVVVVLIETSDMPEAQDYSIQLDWELEVTSSARQDFVDCTKEEAAAPEEKTRTGVFDCFTPELLINGFEWSFIDQEKPKIACRPPFAGLWGTVARIVCSYEDAPDVEVTVQFDNSYCNHYLAPTPIQVRVEVQKSYCIDATTPCNELVGSNSDAVGLDLCGYMFFCSKETLSNSSKFFEELFKDEQDVYSLDYVDLFDLMHFLAVIHKRNNRIDKRTVHRLHRMAIRYQSDELVKRCQAVREAQAAEEAKLVQEAQD